MESTSKYVVSSYIPTISALLSARPLKHPFRLPREELKTLVVAQPTTPGHSALPMTIKEVEILEKIIPPELLLRIGRDDPLSKSNTKRNVDEVAECLTKATVLHLACHGHQDRDDPLNSGFQLEDGRLTISRLISCQTPRAFLAYLSACESASNDLEVPDEALNLAVAMLYAGRHLLVSLIPSESLQGKTGFKSVIGTMWCVVLTSFILLSDTSILKDDE